MSTANDFTGLLEPAVDIARTAGEKILEIYNSDFAVEEKDDRSPLTAADMASHHAIIDGLKALTPDIPVLSEESKSLPFEERSGWQTYWLVDPLDGTREFIKRNGEFTVNIALIRYHYPILGVVHVPVRGTTYTGLVGKWASRHNADGTMDHIRVRKPCADPVAVVGSRSTGAAQFIAGGARCSIDAFFIARLSHDRKGRAADRFPAAALRGVTKPI